MRPEAVIRLLAMLCVLLAALGVFLAVAARQAREEAFCWRAFLEQDERPPKGDCRRL